MILVDTYELCAALDIDSATVWRLVRRGTLPSPYATSGTPLAFWRVDELLGWLGLPIAYALRIQILLIERGRFTINDLPVAA